MAGGGATRVGELLRLAEGEPWRVGSLCRTRELASRAILSQQQVVERPSRWCSSSWSQRVRRAAGERVGVGWLLVGENARQKGKDLHARQRGERPGRVVLSPTRIGDGGSPVRRRHATRGNAPCAITRSRRTWARARRAGIEDLEGFCAQISNCT